MMFGFLVLATILALSVGYQNDFNVTETILTINNKNYVSSFIIQCSDLTPPENALALNRTFYFNASETLPKNAQVTATSNDLSMTLSYPTIIENKGAYDCCVTYNTTFENNTNEKCFRNEITIEEEIFYNLDRKDTLEVSVDRYNFIRLVSEPWDTNTISDINCTFNNESLPTNAKIYLGYVYLSYPYNLAHLIIVDTVAENFGDYQCNVTFANKTSTEVDFSLKEAPTRWYPWTVKEAEKDKNDAGLYQGSLLFVAFSVVLLLSL